MAYDKDRGFIKNITVTGAGSQPLFTVDYGYNSRGDTSTRKAKLDSHSLRESVMQGPIKGISFNDHQNWTYMDVPIPVK